MLRANLFVSACMLASLACNRPAQAADELAKAPVYSVVELSFMGSNQTAKDVPARDIEFWVTFRHDGGKTEHKIHGFWDGDGRGGASGNVFKVRFCPTEAGRWTLAEVHSNSHELKDQRQGDYVSAAKSDLSGFWIIDPDSAGQRWYKRSNGAHQYIFGNTHYSFISGYREGGRPSNNDIVRDIRGNAEYFKKLRFAVHADRYPNPGVHPFFDHVGQGTESGNHSHRPNPAWFQRVDRAVQAAAEVDLVADLILCGPDVEASRSILQAKHNGGDATPYLKYIAARYGSYANVWMCLCNEYDIKEPKYSEQEIARFGRILRDSLPYSTPLSVHASQNVIFSGKFDALPPWRDHQIVQRKLKKLAVSADTMQSAWRGDQPHEPRNKPSINDELSYQGAGDGHSELDTIESHLGAFLGGGYASTGYKPGNKLGQYFIGNFDAREHTAADNLRYLRQVIDENITFRKMAPDRSIFKSLNDEFRAMAWPGQEYVLGTNKARRAQMAELPDGKWTITCYDIVSKESKTLATAATGRFTFESPESRAVLFHFKRR